MKLKAVKQQTTKTKNQFLEKIKKIDITLARLIKGKEREREREEGREKAPMMEPIKNESVPGHSPPSSRNSVASTSCPSPSPAIRQSLLIPQCPHATI